MTCVPAPIAYSDSVAVGACETMRCGRRDADGVADPANVKNAATTVASATASDLRCTSAPFLEGFVGRRAGRSSDSGLPLRRLPGRGQWRRGGGHLPSQRRDRPGLAPGSPTERRFCRRETTMALRGGLARPFSLAARRRVGGPDLHALLDPRPGHRPRRLGLAAAQARACDRVRGARGVGLARARERLGGVLARHRLRGHGRDPPGVRPGTTRVAARRGRRCGRRRSRAPARPSRQTLRVALDLDAVLGDTRPLWDAWLEDAARRFRSIAELDPASLPHHRSEAARELDRWAERGIGDWRASLGRFAEDHAPVYLRPRAPVSAALRRLEAAGARIDVFTDAPEELARVALSHLGAARRVQAVTTQPADGAVVVRSPEQLARLEI